MNLFEFLRPMNDINVEIHIYENWSTTLDENNKVKPCKILETITGKECEIKTNFILRRYIYKWEDLEVFYCGFTSNRSRTLKINVEYKSEK